MATKKFTKKDLVKFGRYLFSKEREERLSNSESNLPLNELSKEVYDADLSNWKNKQK